MTLLVHAATGALIGQYTQNPFLAFFYGLLSHIILDAIPHGDSEIYQKYKNKEISSKKAMAITIIDAVLAIVFVLIFFALDINPSNLTSSMAIIGAIIPDIFIGFYELTCPRPPKILQVIHRWHFKNHDFVAKKHDFTFKKGLAVQTIVFLILIKLL